MELKAVIATICISVPWYLSSVGFKSSFGRGVEKKTLVAPVRNRALSQQSVACYFF
jgi:hypothetical protein